MQQEDNRTIFLLIVFVVICVALISVFVAGALYMLGVYVRNKIRVRWLLRRQRGISKSEYHYFVNGQYCEECFSPQFFTFCREKIREVSSSYVHYEDTRPYEREPTRFAHYYLIVKCANCGHEHSEKEIYHEQVFEGTRVLIAKNLVSLPEVLELWELRKRSIHPDESND